jgi:hypothetical protein
MLLHGILTVLQTEWEECLTTFNIAPTGKGSFDSA